MIKEGFLSSKASLFQEGEEVENMVATNHTGNADTSAHQVMRRYDVLTTFSLESAFDDIRCQVGAEGIRVELVDPGAKRAPVAGSKTKGSGSPKRSSGRPRK